MTKLTDKLLRDQNKKLTDEIKRLEKISKENSKDPILDLTTRFHSLQIKTSHITHFGPTSRFSLMLNDPVLIKVTRAVKKSWTERAKTLVENLNVNISQSVDTYTMLGNGDNANNAKQSEFINQIESILPRRKYCFILLNIYWNTYDYIWSIMDKDISYPMFEKVIGISELGFCKINIETSADYTILSLFLLCLRIAYIVLPYVGEDTKNISQILSIPRYQQFQSLVNNNIIIGPEYLALADEFLRFRKGPATIYLLYYMMLLRQYHVIAPEDGDGVDMEDSSILFGSIVSLAISFGYNRDPDNIPEIIDERTKYYRRKVWLYILFCDTAQAANLGRPVLISSEAYDTKPPTIFKEAENDLKIRSDCDFSVITYDLTSCIRESIEKNFSLNSHTRRSFLVQYAQQLLNFLRDKLPLFSHLLIYTPPENLVLRAERIRLIQCRLLLTTQVYINYYILYLNCGPDEVELSHLYLRYALGASLIIFEVSIKFIKNCKKYFGYESVAMVAPVILRATQRALQLVVSILVRSQSEKYKYSVPSLNFLYDDSQFMDHLDLYEGLVVTPKDPLMIYIGQFYEQSKVLSNKYFYSWRMMHSLWIIIGIIEKNIKFSISSSSDEDITTGQQDSKAPYYGETMRINPISSMIPSDTKTIVISAPSTSTSIPSNQLLSSEEISTEVQDTEDFTETTKLLPDHDKDEIMMDPTQSPFWQEIFENSLVNLNPNDNNAFDFSSLNVPTLPDESTIDTTFSNTQFQPEEDNLFTDIQNLDDFFLFASNDNNDFSAHIT